MFLSRLTLDNFRCFQSASIDMEPITLLLGSNSSGKSSIIYAILSALQSEEFPLLFSPNGDYVDLGDYRSIAYRHRQSRSMSIGLDFTGHHLGPVSLSASFIESHADRMPSLTKATYKDSAFRLEISKEEKYDASWQYDMTADPVAKQVGDSQQLRSIILAFAKLTAETRATKKRPTPADLSEGDQLSLLTEPRSEGRFSFNNPKHFMSAFKAARNFLIAQHASSVTQTTKSFGSRFNYVGSFRSEPERTYYHISKADLKIRRGGENYIHQIADWEQEGGAQYRRLLTSLRRLKLLQDLKTGRLKGGRFELRVKMSSSDVASTIADVGFGVSQLLPILVADIQLAANSTLALSQPEIHLHPSIQAGLGDYFVDRVKNHRRRYIIETHSEYLLNRFRLLIAQGRLESKDVAVYFLENDGGESKIHRITFERNGQIAGAPQGFFDTYMMDVMNIALSAS